VASTSSPTKPSQLLTNWSGLMQKKHKLSCEVGLVWWHSRGKIEDEKSKKSSEISMRKIRSSLPWYKRIFLFFGKIIQ